MWLGPKKIMQPIAFPRIVWQSAGIFVPLPMAKIGCSSAKKSIISFVLRSACTTFVAEKKIKTR